MQNGVSAVYSCVYTSAISVSMMYRIISIIRYAERKANKEWSNSVIQKFCAFPFLETLTKRRNVSPFTNDPNFVLVAVLLRDFGMSSGQTFFLKLVNTG